MVFIHLQFFFEIVRADIYGVQIWSIDHESLQFAIDGIEKEMEALSVSYTYYIA